jgi:hypothetical protein
MVISNERSHKKRVLLCLRSLLPQLKLHKNRYQIFPVNIKLSIIIGISLMEDAKSVGVKYPGRVRIYEVPQIRMSKHPILRAAAGTTQLISAVTIGISFSYGIFIHVFSYFKSIKNLFPYFFLTKY